ncbi:MAG: hypothetical protein SFY81_01470 [Verrucomicrobiota bacterium]|nr:hypothetical protein [Verrucomicrobiota bacterium]
MKLSKLTFAAALLGFAASSFAALKPGDSLTPYEIKNVATGKEYCQVCQYGGKPAKVIAFGKLDDAEFWADLKKLQTIADKNKEVGVFAQVLDSKDIKAIKAAADKNGITFPVVVAVEKDWDNAYKVEGVSRTVYYAKKQTIAWTGVGLDDKAVEALKSKIAADVKS